jgi:hypothetical protein
MSQITLEDGKYTVVYEAGVLTALRNGEPWRDMVGDKLVGAMFDEIERLRAVVDEVHSWAVCACIASPEDMAQNFPHIVEITAPGGDAPTVNDTKRLDWLLPIVTGEDTNQANLRTVALAGVLAHGRDDREAIDIAMEHAP